LGAVGMLGGIYAQKFDQMAAIGNFIVTPLAFLSGTFYSITALPSVLQPAVYINPMFYIIDGGRFGVLGVSDSAPALALAVVVGVSVVATALVWFCFKRGYRLKA
ncbi:MAG: ABC transporter permease, partial [Planktomarina sp.]